MAPSVKFSKLQISTSHSLTCKTVNTGSLGDTLVLHGGVAYERLPIARTFGPHCAVYSRVSTASKPSKKSMSPSTISVFKNGTVTLLGVGSTVVAERVAATVARMVTRRKRKNKIEIQITGPGRVLSAWRTATFGRRVDIEAYMTALQANGANDVNDVNICIRGNRLHCRSQLGGSAMLFSSGKMLCRATSIEKLLASSWVLP